MCHLSFSLTVEKCVSRLVLDDRYIPVAHSDTNKLKFHKYAVHYSHTLMLIQLKDMPS